MSQKSKGAFIRGIIRNAAAAETVALALIFFLQKMPSIV
jgi:hypothetical protein